VDGGGKGRGHTFGVEWRSFWMQGKKVQIKPGSGGRKKSRPRPVAKLSDTLGGGLSTAKGHSRKNWFWGKVTLVKEDGRMSGSPALRKLVRDIREATREIRKPKEREGVWVI